MGKLAGGFIDVYLLEKSRVTYQQPNERCYHIFFQLIEPGIVDGLQELVLMSTDPYDYFFFSQVRTHRSFHVTHTLTLFCRER